MSETDPMRPPMALEPFTDGVVELRKRGKAALNCWTAAGGPEGPLAAMARRAAERAGRPRA
ncbi:hypothetical protein ACODT3_05675 [Streptomyces sp. 4.24]|uniref:hypothetical protein n=1 Tax=Streptomyces tritrimontium TaxID=3406573 RepID=UPI003BB60E7A